jgi:5,10-methylenetetrahydrofolate reductase
MKITEKLAKAEREGRTFWSFEYFPPRTAQVGQSVQFADHVELSMDKGGQINAD